MSRISAIVVLLASLPVSAAIIYEPVQFQYGSGCRYYYGGTDAVIHRFAQSSCDRRIIRDAEGQLSCKPARVFSDCFPRLNASLYGFTVNDAKNAAYAAMPRYFQMRSLLSTGHVDGAGDLVVPATSSSGIRGAVEIKPWRGWHAVKSPKPVIVVPKTQMRLDAPLAIPGMPSKA